MIAATNISPMVFDWRIFAMVTGTILVAWLLVQARKFYDGDKR